MSGLAMPDGGPGETVAAVPAPAWFLGLKFSALEMSGALAAMDEAAAGTTWRYVVTPNAAHLARLGSKGGAEIADLLSIYRRAEFCFLDSRVVALVARLAGQRPPPVVPGSDLVERLFRERITPDTPICIVGGRAETVAHLRERFGLRSVRHMNPSFGFWRDAAEMADIVAFVQDSRADYTFLTVGSPQQEILAARVGAAGGARGVGLCAGASIDFIVGVQRRAPPLLRRLALEWAYRLWMEPRRLAIRYFVESPRGLLFVLRGGRGDPGQDVTSLAPK